MSDIVKMPKLGIPVSDVEMLSAYIDSIRGRARTHTVSADEVISAAESAEYRLKGLGVSKRKRIGAKHHIEIGGRYICKAYKYSIQTSAFTLRRRSSGWYLVSYDKYTAYADTKSRDVLVLRQDIADAAAQRYLDRAGVVTWKPVETPVESVEPPAVHLQIAA